MRKKLNRSQLTKKLDRIFSQYIRLRDADQFGDCYCITCNQKLPWKEMHAGHFIPRGCRTTRWHEQNVHAQCCGCNTYRFGEQAKHLLQIESRYGRAMVTTLMDLERKYKSGNYTKLSLPDMRDLIEHYKEEIKKL